MMDLPCPGKRVPVRNEWMGVLLNFQLARAWYRTPDGMSEIVKTEECSKSHKYFCTDGDGGSAGEASGQHDGAAVAREAPSGQE